MCTGMVAQLHGGRPCSAMSFILAKSGTVKATLTWNNRDNDLDLYLILEDGEVIARSTSATNTSARIVAAVSDHQVPTSTTSIRSALFTDPSRLVPRHMSARRWSGTPGLAGRAAGRRVAGIRSLRPCTHSSA